MSSQLRHDLRGAAVNISGFHAECTLAATELRETLAPHLDDLPENVRLALIQLIDDDLLACLGFLGASIEKLDAIIETTGPDTSTGAGHAD